jgi:hypothetical protein
MHTQFLQIVTYLWLKFQREGRNTQNLRFKERSIFALLQVQYKSRKGENDSEVLAAA